MTEEANILSPGERERNEIVGYIQLILDSLNELIVKYRSELKEMGVINKLVVIIGIITMHKYNPEVYMRSYWEELVSLINTIKQDKRIANDLRDLEALIEKVNSLRKLAGL